MTSPLLNFDPPQEPVYREPKKIDPDSRLARVAGLFMRRRGEWIDSEELAAVGGRCAWRTRCSECRTLLGMDIQNRQRKADAGYVISEYRYAPSEA